MSSYDNVWRLDLRLKPSRMAQALQLLLHGAAVGAVLAAALSWWWQLLLVFAIVLALAWQWRCERQQVLHLREQGLDWWLETRTASGPVRLCRLRVWRYLVIMDFQGREASGWRQRVVIFPDMLSADEFRRLRVRLRYGRPMPAKTPIDTV